MNRLREITIGNVIDSVSREIATRKIAEIDNEYESFISLLRARMNMEQGKKKINLYPKHRKELMGRIFLQIAFRCLDLNKGFEYLTPDDCGRILLGNILSNRIKQL